MAEPQYLHMTLAPPPRHEDASLPFSVPPPFALDPPGSMPAGDSEIPADKLDPDALKVIARLRHARHQAYLVGGCVRDVLLDRTPKDFDVATDAHPGEVRALFRNCRLIGRRFRLAHVYFRSGKVIEIATFRANPVDILEDVPGETDLLITRDNVFGTAEQDARRRDFTVNGLFYDTFSGKVIDYVAGQADLEAHRIATIGDPEIRMREDPIRSLRAVRFAARLGFTIAPDTFLAMRRHVDELERCAPPRVLEEIFKILRCGRSARAFELLRAIGALPIILPPLASALDEGNDEMRRRFFAHLSALDDLVASKEEVSEAVLLGAVLVHLEERAEEAPDERALSMLDGFVQTSRLPRRVAERVRLALSAQRILKKGPHKRRRRRKGRVSGQSYYRDAVQLLEIAVRATGEGGAELEQWKAALSKEPEARADGHSPNGDRTAPKHEHGQSGTAVHHKSSDHPQRRKRRGGRRRRRRGGGEVADGPGP